MSSFSKLFNTRITHNFYEDAISRNDLAVIPVESTRIAMKNGNMLFRNDDQGFRVMYKTDIDGGPFIDFENVNLVFALELINKSEFMNFTDLNASPARYSAGKILYFTNRIDPLLNDLDYSLIDLLRPSNFTYEFPDPAVAPAPDYGSITITDQQGNDVTPAYPDPENILPDASGRYFYPIDFSKLPKGLYEFATATTNGASNSQKIYIDNELARQGVFGIVDILVENADASSFPEEPEVPRLYNMNFLRRNTQWQYVVVLKSPSVNLDPVPVIDIQDVTDPPYQAPYGQLTFGSATDATVNGYPAKIITSVQDNIPYFSGPKKGLSVIKDPGAGEVTVITDLPGPPLGLVSADPENVNITKIFVVI